MEMDPLWIDIITRITLITLIALITLITLITLLTLMKTLITLIITLIVTLITVIITFYVVVGTLINPTNPCVCDLCLCLISRINPCVCDPVFSVLDLFDAPVWARVMQDVLLPVFVPIHAYATKRTTTKRAASPRKVRLVGF